MNLEHKTTDFIKKHSMIFKGAGIVIGLSGGADSVALLEVLCSLREEFSLKLAAVHVHHGIRPEADQDAEFCRMLCKEKKVTFFAEYVDVLTLAEKQGLTVEEAGRLVRYECFEKYRKQLKFDLIAVAHHENDRAETMLFQLFRGSGLKGLTGIPVKRGYIIRPLLGVSREEIEVYLAAKDLPFVTDSTNDEDVYTRNKIRHHILPVAEEISVGAVEHMNQTATQLREVLDYMVQQTCVFFDANVMWSGEALAIPLKELKETHIALRKMIVLEAMERVMHSRKDITEKHVQGVLALLDKEGEKSIHLPNGYCVTKRYEELRFTRALDSKRQAGTQELIIEPDRIYELENGVVLRTRLFFDNKLENIPKSDCIKWFDYDKIVSVLSWRSRKPGDFLTIRDDGARKSLQDYFVNEKIPKGERDQYKVLADGQHIIWVPGKRISAHYKVTKDTKRVLEVHIGGK